jgi:hypothetical protein
MSMKKTEAIRLVAELVDIAWDIAVAAREGQTDAEVEGHIEHLKYAAAKALGVSGPF